MKQTQSNKKLAKKSTILFHLKYKVLCYYNYLNMLNTSIYFYIKHKNIFKYFPKTKSFNFTKSECLLHNTSLV